MHVAAQLICAFVFAYAKSWFSHDVAHILQAYQEQMISCSREILDSIEKIRRAAAKEPENLGHQVNKLKKEGNCIQGPVQVFDSILSALLWNVVRVLKIWMYVYK